MASKQTRNLVGELDDKKKIKGDVIDFVTEKKEPIEDKLDNFDPSTQGLDNKVLSIIAATSSKQQQIVSIANTGQFIAGCGTTSVENVNEDLLQGKTWNLSNESYSGTDPFGGVTNNTITASNAGIGSMNVYTNSGGSSLGTYYGLEGPGYGTSVDGVTAVTPTATDNANCTACKNAITALNSEIATLRAQVSPLIVSINSLKEERSELQKERYGLNRTAAAAQVELDRIQEALDVLNDPDYDSLI